MGVFEGQSIRENYCLGVSQSNTYRTVTGSQDNGTSIKTENGWIEFYGADGMEGIIHSLNDDWMIEAFSTDLKEELKMVDIHKMVLIQQTLVVIGLHL